MWNYWLNLAAKRHVKRDLDLRFLGQNYLQSADMLTQFAQKHSYWNNNFQIHITVNENREIEKIEIRENPCTY